MAWLMGYIKHFDGRLKDGSLYVGWIDGKTNDPVEDKDVKGRYEKDIWLALVTKHLNTLFKSRITSSPIYIYLVSHQLAPAPFKDTPELRLRIPRYCHFDRHRYWHTEGFVPARHHSVQCRLVWVSTTAALWRLVVLCWRPAQFLLSVLNQPFSERSSGFRVENLQMQTAAVCGSYACGACWPSFSLFFSLFYYSPLLSLFFVNLDHAFSYLFSPIQIYFARNMMRLSLHLQILTF